MVLLNFLFPGTLTNHIAFYPRLDFMCSFPFIQQIIFKDAVAGEALTSPLSHHLIMCFCDTHLLWVNLLGSSPSYRAAAL